MTREIPLIKEYRVSKLVECLKCIDRFTYRREKQRDCILSLYPNKKEKDIEHREKSIFRGMIIPSLRYLGLIIGYGDSIKPSANGELIIKSQFSSDLHERCLRAVIYEVDMEKFHFLNTIKQYRKPKREFVKKLNSQITGTSEKQKKERIEKWLSILYQVKLIKNKEVIGLDEENYSQLLLDLDHNLKDFDKFKKYILNEYYKLGKDSAGIVDIRDLREFVGITFLRECGEILTESQFDHMFRKFISTAKDLNISLGEPMGADQKLFEYRDNFYKTVYIIKRRNKK